MLARLEVEEELIPDERLLALEMEVTPARLCILRMPEREDTESLCVSHWAKCVCVFKSIVPYERVRVQAMDRRAASLRQEQEAARREILLFQKAVEEELYESDSDADEMVLEEMLNQDHLAAAAAAAVSAASNESRQTK